MSLGRGIESSARTGGAQRRSAAPVASQEAIKELGTNGGGFLNANSAHPFENPNPLSNLLEIFLLLVIPFALHADLRPDGRLDRRRASRSSPSMGGPVGVDARGHLVGRGAHARRLRPRARRWRARRSGSAIRGSALFATLDDMTSTGAVNSHARHLLGRSAAVVPLLNMLLGE